MVESHAEQLEALAARLDEVKRYLQIDFKKSRRAELHESSAAPGFWDDSQAAQAAMAEISRLTEDIKAYDAAEELLGEAQSADELALEADDEETAAYAAESMAQLERVLDELELSSWFTGKFDHGDAIVTVTPGQGGLEAQDWALMLLVMYRRYCERRKWKFELLDCPAAEVIGIDRATFRVSGKDVFGMLSAEAGVHRLVRISPTDDKKRRQTTFAGVEVIPVLPDDVTVEIDMADIRVDVFHASGPGGQGVNTTDSAVRVTHIPTGIAVACQTQRSQLQNKATALEILKARLYEIEYQKREAELDEIRGPKTAIGFGNQIRSYVLYPYQMVKDLRTGWETSDVEGVLEDGDLDPFVIAYHRWRVLETAQAEPVE